MTGVPYKLYDLSNFSFSNLKGDGSWKPEAIYQVDDESAEYIKRHKKGKMLRDLYDDPDNDPDFEKAYDRMVPAKRIRIQMKLVNGFIVPIQVATGW